MADLKRKQLKEFLSGSFGITGSLNVTGSVEFDKNISGSITSTGSFHRIESDTFSATHTIFASGSTVQNVIDATGSYASASTTYVKESQTGSFGSGSDVQGLLDTYVRQSESSSFASGSDLQVILAESASYLFNASTASLGKVTLASDITGSITSTGSFGKVFVGDILGSPGDTDTYIDFTTDDEINFWAGGERLLHIDEAGTDEVVVGDGGHVNFRAATAGYGYNLYVKSTNAGGVANSVGIRTQSPQSVLDITGDLKVSSHITASANISGSGTATASFGKLELVDTVHISPFASGSDVQTILDTYASGSDLHAILAESSSYVMSTNTSSFLQNSDTSSFATLHVEGNITTSGSVTAQEFHTEVVSSSIIYESGSTTFGDTLDDIHRITGSLQITGSSLSIDNVGGVSGSIASTASFGKLELVDSVHISPFASGSDVQTISDTYASGSDLQIILAESASYVVSTGTGSYASGSDVQVILAESASYVVSTNTGSYASGSSVQTILDDYAKGTEISGSYLGLLSGSNDLTLGLGVSGSLLSTGSFGNLKLVNYGGLPFASGSDVQVILAESSSYLNNNSTSSLGKLTLVSDITSSITSTASFGRVDVADNTFILGSLGIGTSTQGDRLQVAGDATIVGSLDTLNSVSGGLSSTGSFGYVEALGVKLLNSNQTASFASGSDLHTILAQSASYMISDQTGSMGATTMASTLTVAGDIMTSGSVIAREFKTEFVSSSIIFASGSQVFGDSEDDTHAFSGSVNIGDMVLSGSRVGVSSDLDLLTLSTNTLTINGNIVIDDGANIGIDSDTNLLDLNDQNLIVNGILDSTGRIDAQAGLQVSGSSLQVGNDLTLNYTSPVSHSLMYVNYSNKTVDLVPAASASGQIVIFNGTSWAISDEIDGGSF